MYKAFFAFCILYGCCTELAVVVLAQQQQQQQQQPTNDQSPHSTTTAAISTPEHTSATASATPTPTPLTSSSSDDDEQHGFNSSQSTTTTSVLTHLSMPSRAASSSTLSSFHPSPSAPYPDDSVGKYGPLHVSGANSPSIFYQGIVALILLVSSTFLLVSKL
ncbi:hypothetical protein BDB00DRAFT_281085 [Zychaea mexicana]|uniref:uncharacterized protein n=1 Tax=Zychaea mexicana TaxID=64656 RepID=UPI0022FE3C69|nr:uncharacterized protein BDB00DRAFT_281085 [Zychaea mexicana]KAI9494978.1 hypothetical protein BDB00DRAFT_281085 [Zychaea mexicana]